MSVTVRQGEGEKKKQGVGGRPREADKAVRLALSQVVKVVMKVVVVVW